MVSCRLPLQAAGPGLSRLDTVAGFARCQIAWLGLNRLTQSTAGLAGMASSADVRRG